MRPFSRLVLLVPLAAAAASSPTRTENVSAVTVRAGALEAGGAPVSFVCADGVSLPEPGGEDVLAERLAACGFDMVRLPDASSAEDTARFDALAAACSRRGMRLWADALVPALAVPPSPADVSLIDDPATAAAWTNALAEAEENRFDPFLAAPWDPRLESLLQRRIRAWIRALNPATGRRRNEDPAWTLVGFSSGWRNAFLFSASATNAPVPPAFFRDGFLAEWNNWLWERYDGDDEVAADVLLPGESIVSNSVAWIGSPFGAPAAGRLPRHRLRDEKTFLRELYLGHAGRLASYFREAGGRAEDVPVFFRWGEGPKSLLAKLSDIRFAGASEPGFPTVGFFPADGGFEAFETAAGAGASVVTVPCGGDPVPFAPWARLLRAKGTGLEWSGRDGVSAEGPDGSVVVGTVPFRSWRSDPADDAAVPGDLFRPVLLRPDDDPDDFAPAAAGGNGLSVLVWIRSPAPSAVAERRVEYVFAPDSTGAPTSLFIRVRDPKTGDDVPFGLVVAGSRLRKCEWCDLASAAEPEWNAVPEDRVLRLPGAPGPRLLLFRPGKAESDILKRLEAEGVRF